MRPRLRILFENFLVFSAHFTGGAISLLFAKYSVYASPIWISAGIALAAVLLIGKRILPGIVMASVLLNPELLTVGSDPVKISEIIFSNLPIGIGSALQAWLGAFLIRKAIGWPNLLATGREVFLFLALGGPVACLLNACIAIFTLRLRGLLSSEIIGFEWFTWYSGDTIGVLVITPILLTLFCKPRDIWQKRAKIMAIPCLTALILTQYAFMQTRGFENRRVQARFTNRAHSLVARFQDDLKFLDRLPLALQAQESRRPESRHFQLLSKVLLALHPDIQSIFWADYFPDQKHGQQILISMIEPHLPSDPVLRQEIRSATKIIEAFELSARSQKSVVIMQRQSGHASDPDAHLLYVPLFDGQKLLGFFGLKVRSEELFFGSISGFLNGSDDLAVTITELDSVETPVFSYTPRSEVAKRPQSMKYETELSLENVIGAKWKISITPTENFLYRNRSLQSWILLACGLVFSGLLGGFLLALAGKKEVLNEIAGQLKSELFEKEKAHENNRRLERDLAHIWRVNTMGEMAAGLAHELSQPISAIGNYCQALIRLISADAKDPMLAQETLSEISKETQRATKFIQNLRAFVKTRKPSQTNEKMNDIIHEILALVSGELNKNKMTVELKLEATHAVVFVDRVQVGQVILNLLRNAIESMTSQAPCKIVIETNYEMPGFAKLSVIDQGCGISHEHLDQIFKPFFSTKEDGMGMGLAISKSIVEAHSGRLWVESKPKEGTAFYMTLPLA